MELTKRNPAVDLIRILAFFFVVSVHYLLHNGFYSAPVAGIRMYIMVLMRSLFIICVPLFLTLSGYLSWKKQLQKSYYKKIGKIIVTYILACLLCVIYSVAFLGEGFSVKNTVLGIFGFEAAPYSWYIEMYLGLFLLIPFLNIVYHALPSQKAKLWLIITLVLLTALPSVVNVYNFESLSWWTSPSSSSTTNQLMPAWWVSIYPITYYYIGCYLRQYGLKLKKAFLLALIVLVTVLSGTFYFWRFHNTAFVQSWWNTNNSLFAVILTVLVFALFMNIKTDRFPRWLSVFLQKVSGLCLGAYLISWIFDKALYGILLQKVPNASHRIEYFLVVVPAVFVLSLAASYLLSKLQLVLEILCAKLTGMLRKSKSHPEC